MVAIDHDGFFQPGDLDAAIECGKRVVHDPATDNQRDSGEQEEYRDEAAENSVGARYFTRFCCSQLAAEFSAANEKRATALSG